MLSYTLAMEQLDFTPLNKARDINLDPGFYGTFAEIGAGQEVARYFFLAGRASQTVAKTMSAYDMTFSDAIYGKSSRYVCEERVIKMLDHEFKLIVERLDQQRGEKTRFFAFADTVATSSHGEPTAKCHGWLGIRFQTRPRGPTNDILVHVRMKDRTRLLQQEALGILGINLLHLSHKPPQSRQEIVEKLIQTITIERVELNLIRFNGPDFKHIDNRLLNLETVKQGLTEAVLFDADGTISNPSDSLFKRPILVQRGMFRPVTNINVSLSERGMAQFQSTLPKGTTPEVLFELTMDSLSSEPGMQDSDFLDRVEALCTLGHKVLLSKFKLFYQLKSFLRTYTNEPVGIIVGAAHLEKLFDPKFYEGLPGGMLEGFSRLFDDNTQILVFPFKSDDVCLTTKNFYLQGALQHLYKYLTAQNRIVDILNCDDVDTSIHSQDVRAMLATGDAKWQKLVPPSVRDLILKRKLFGIRE
jgi:hypothetical protein